MNHFLSPIYFCPFYPILLLIILYKMYILSAYELTFEYEQDEDGKFAGSVEQIEGIVAEGDTIEDLLHELARQLIEYAQDYYSNFLRYYNSPNRQRHAYYVFRVLLEDDIERVASIIHA